ncbi:MAG TPA: TlyA family RNA methyltransferase [Terriglobales bacterium]|nr:TlyA family RNA methyltransferase [Terriglobales bacterium]
MKNRIDKLLVELGLVASRERAQALILAGRVLVNEQKVEKAGTAVDVGARIRLLGEDLRYVSRAGLKLEAALEHWQIDVRGLTCVDVGASTGGFTDCLLQHGAGRVIAIDTGYGQMDLKIREDPRVRLREKTNARYLQAGDLGEPVDLIVIDVSFISATLVIPAVVEAAIQNDTRDQARPKQMIVLVKPQFEVGREHVGKGGIVRDTEQQASAVAKVRQAVEQSGFDTGSEIESPILGTEGNREFLLYGRRKQGN